MKLSENPYKKSIMLGLTLFGPLLIMIIAGCVSRHQARNALREAEQEVFVEWFGVDETTYQYALIWEESGLVGLGILDQDQIDGVLSSRRVTTSAQQTQEDVEALLTGGFPIIDESGFNAARFRSAVSIINQNVEDVQIRNAWYDLIGGNSE